MFDVTLRGYAPRPTCTRREAASVLRTVWPTLRVSLRPKELKLASVPLHMLWIERWGISRRSTILVTQAAGAPLPSARAMVDAVRQKLEGTGMLPMG